MLTMYSFFQLLFSTEAIVLMLAMFCFTVIVTQHLQILMHNFSLSQFLLKLRK